MSGARSPRLLVAVRLGLRLGLELRLVGQRLDLLRLIGLIGFAGGRPFHSGQYESFGNRSPHAISRWNDGDAVYKDRHGRSIEGLRAAGGSQKARIARYGKDDRLRTR